MTTTKVPVPRIARMSLYSSGGESATHLGDRTNGTWVEDECFAYPAGGFTRRAYVELARNRHNPIELPYGERRMVRVSIPDTMTTIPARLKIAGRTVKGYVSVTRDDYDDATARFTFTPGVAGDGHDYLGVCPACGTSAS